MLGLIAVSLFMGIILLAKATRAKIAERPLEQLIGAPADYHQKTLIVQLAESVFHDFPFGLVPDCRWRHRADPGASRQITAFNGFPVLGSILAQDRYLPRQLHTRGDRLASLQRDPVPRVAAMAFVVAFRAEVTALIQLYIVGVFVSFTFEPDRHGAALDVAAAHRRGRRERRHMQRSRVINTVGFICTRTVLIIVVPPSSWPAPGSRSWRCRRCSC